MADQNQFNIMEEIQANINATIEVEYAYAKYQEFLTQKKAAQQQQAAQQAAQQQKAAEKDGKEKRQAEEARRNNPKKEPEDKNNYWGSQLNTSASTFGVWESHSTGHNTSSGNNEEPSTSSTNSWGDGAYPVNQHEGHNEVWDASGQGPGGSWK